MVKNIDFSKKKRSNLIINLMELFKKILSELSISRTGKSSMEM